MGIVTKNNFDVKPITEPNYRLYAKLKDKIPERAVASPRDFIFCVTCDKAPKTADGESQKLRSTTKRTCKVYVDSNGDLANLWHMEELNSPFDDPASINTEGMNICLVTLTFQIPIYMSVCGKNKKYTRWLPPFMCNRRIDSVKLIVNKAISEDSDEKITDMDTNGYYECSVRAKERARNYLIKLQTNFIDLHTYAKDISVSRLMEEYVIDIFAKDYIEGVDRLIYSPNGATNWPDTKDMPIKVFRMLHPPSRNS